MIRVRDARHRDFTQMELLEEAYLGENAFNAEALAYYRDCMQSIILVATVSSMYAGHIVSVQHPDHREIFVSSLVVGSDYRRMGVGTALLKRIVSRCRKQNYRLVRAIPYESQQAMQQLLKKCGFRCVSLSYMPEGTEYEFLWHRDPAVLKKIAFTVSHCEDTGNVQMIGE